MLNKAAVKTIVLGASSAGKTALVTRCLTDQFFHHYVTRSDVSYHIEKSKLVMDIVDSSGKNDALISYADCIIMVYSVTDKQSFEHLEKLLAKVRYLNMNNAVTAIVGTKNDKSNQRQVLLKEGKDFAIENECLFYETSSFIPKYNLKEEIFLKLGKQAKLRRRKYSEPSNRIMGSIRNFIPKRRANTFG